jgi:dienelactone hydrolase
VRLVAHQKAHGQDAEITTYPGAHHSFDNIGRALVRLPHVYSAAGCWFDLPSITATVPESELARCRHRGATVGWNPDATEAARKLVVAQLGALLR